MSQRVLQQIAKFTGASSRITLEAQCTIPYGVYLRNDELIQREVITALTNSGFFGSLNVSADFGVTNSVTFIIQGNISNTTNETIRQVTELILSQLQMRISYVIAYGSNFRMFDSVKVRVITGVQTEISAAGLIKEQNEANDWLTNLGVGLGVGTTTTVFLIIAGLIIYKKVL